MDILFGLLINALIAWWSYNLAGNRGRNEWGWAIAGFLFGLLVPLILWLVGPTVAKANQDLVEQMKLNQ